MLQDDRNAALYADAKRQLEELNAGQLAEVATAADAGDTARVAVFLRNAQAILDADHRAWMLVRPKLEPSTGRVPDV